MILEFKDLYYGQFTENSEKLFFSIFLFSSYLITEEITKFEKWKNSPNEKAGPDWDKNFLFRWLFKNLPSLRRYRDQKLIYSYLITEELGCLRRCHKICHTVAGCHCSCRLSRGLEESKNARKKTMLCFVPLFWFFDPAPWLWAIFLIHMKFKERVRRIIAT